MAYDPKKHCLDMTIGAGLHRCYDFPGNEKEFYEMLIGDERGPAFRIGNPSGNGGYIPVLQSLAAGHAHALLYEQRDWDPAYCEMVANGVAEVVKTQEQMAKINSKHTSLGRYLRRAMWRKLHE